jgi:hypothetical protein
VVARADGTHERLLVPYASDPAWSPGGRRIAFVGDCAHTGVEIGIVGANQRGIRKLTRC